MKYKLLLIGGKLLRKAYIDNLRTFCILLLFPFHTFMIYNNWGETFYINGPPLTITSWFNHSVYPWWMTLLFTLAGISSAYALQKRSSKDFTKERISKLLVPLLVGLLIIVPVQTYIADLSHYGYSGNYWTHYGIYLSRFTDLSGIDGGFTPAHLWFMLYLFIISMIMLPLMNSYNKRDKKINPHKITLVHLIPLFLVISACIPFLNIEGKSIGEFLACFAIGYFLLSDEVVHERLAKYVFPLALVFVSFLILRLVLNQTDLNSDLIDDIARSVIVWFGILTMIAIFKKYFNFENNITRYLSSATFSLYYFHQSVLVVLGYFILKSVSNVFLQIPCIILGSFIISLACYEISRRFKLTAFLFGIKYKSNKRTTPHTPMHSS